MNNRYIWKTTCLFFWSLVLTLTFGALSTEACTTVLVGKEASADGSTMVARNEDMSTAWTKHFVIRQENTNESSFISKGNGFTIELPTKQLKYTATPEWDTSEGLYEEAGINSKNVGMSATESATTKESVLSYDPLIENGIAEDSMLTVVLPYISSPKEGVERLGKIVEEKGAAEVNGVIFSDKNDIWYMEIVSGHHWVAVRVPDNSYAVIANTLSIGKIDLTDTSSVMVSTGFEEFIKKNKLSKSNEKISVREIFAETKDDAQYNTPRVWDGQRNLTPSNEKKITDTDFNLFEKPDQPITLAKVAYVMALHFNGTEYDTFGEKKADKYRPISVPNTMESHILQFRKNVADELSGIHWLALGVTDTSNYVPFYSGITETPDTYQIGTDQPDAESAYWIYRSTNALTVPYYNDFKPNETLPLRQEVRDYLLNEVKVTDTEASRLLKEHPDELSSYLTKRAQEASDYSLEQYKKLNQKLIIQMTEKTNTSHKKSL